MILLAIFDFFKFLVFDIPVGFFAQISSFTSSVLAEIPGFGWIIDIMAFGVEIINFVSGDSNFMKIIVTASIVLIPIEIIASIFWWVLGKLPFINVQKR